jgi:hypothetical protein
LALFDRLEMQKAVVAFALYAVLSGCATGDLFREIQPGMQRTEVIKKLGNPDGAQLSGEYEALRYANRLMSGWSWDKADYTVILRNGSVVEYGPGQARQQSPNINTLVLVPLR